MSDALAGAARLGGGALADDPGRRRATAVGGDTATAVMSSLIGAAGSAWRVGVRRAGAWTARGPAGALAQRVARRRGAAEAYGRAFGFERAMDNLGAIGGPLLAIALVAAFSTRTASVLSPVPGLLAALAIVYAVRHLPRLALRERRPIRLRVCPVLRGRLGALMIGVGAFELGNVAATLLILRATELLEPVRRLDSATTAALLLSAGDNLAAALASIPAGQVGDRRGTVRVLAGGALLFAAAYAVLAATGASPLLLLAGFVLAGIGIGCVETAEHAAVASLAPQDLRGSAFGVLAAVQSLGNLAASAIAGLLWTLVSPEAAFAYAAGGWCWPSPSWCDRERPCADAARGRPRWRRGRQTRGPSPILAEPLPPESGVTDAGRRNVVGHDATEGHHAALTHRTLGPRVPRGPRDRDRGPGSVGARPLAPARSRAARPGR